MPYGTNSLTYLPSIGYLSPQPKIFNYAGNRNTCLALIKAWNYIQYKDDTFENKTMMKTCLAPLKDWHHFQCKR